MGLREGLFLSNDCFCPKFPFFPPKKTRNFVSLNFPFFFFLPNAGMLRPMTMETRCCKDLFPNYSKNVSAEDNARTAAMGKNGEKMLVLLVFSFTQLHAAARGGTCTFALEIVSTLIKTAHVTIDLRSRHRTNPRQTRFVSGTANECR